MLDELLKAVRKYGITFPAPGQHVISMELLEQIVRKYITPENAEKWLQELKEQNKQKG